MLFSRKNRLGADDKSQDDAPKAQRSDSFARGSFGMNRLSMGNFSDELVSIEDELDDERQRDKAATEAAVEREKISSMAQQHAQKAKIWRRNVLILMLVVWAVFSVGTFTFLQREQEEDLETSVRQQCLPCTGSSTSRF